MIKLHVIKCLAKYFTLVAEGIKTFEIRFNDRNYLEGDYLMLYEIEDESKKLTGRFTYVKVLQILFEFEGLKEGFVCMSIQGISQEEEDEMEKAPKRTN